MARLEPVRARLIRPDWALRVPSPAHDLLTPDDRRRYVAANPDTFLRVTRGPEDVEPGGQWSSADAVAASRDALERLLGAGAWGDLAPPALYLLRLATPADDATRAAGAGGHAQIGIVGNLSVDDYEQGVIRVHERVHDHRAGHLADHLTGLRIQSSPITVAHRADPELSGLVAAIAADTDPALDFTSPDGLHQQVWRVTEPSRIAALQRALARSPLYVIDGHHRAAAAAVHRRRSPDPEADWMLSVVFPADELRNQAFHRVLHGVDPADLLARLRTRFTVRSGVGLADVVGRRADELALLTGITWHLVDLGPVPPSSPTSASTSADPLASLDAVRLEHEVLQPLVDLTTTRPEGRLTYRVGDPGPAELATWSTGPDEALWLMRPVPLDVVLDAADAGAVMPPKSTFFQPKARSGVFLRPHPTKR